MTSGKQLAITKTPANHGTYCLRVVLTSNAMMEYLSSRAQTLDELIESLEARIVDLKRFQQAEPRTVTRQMDVEVTK